MAKVYLICGPIGSGKTTYSQRLALEKRALNFNIDDWMVTLFGADAPTPIQLPWALERTERCSRQIWKISQQALALGMDVVLDLGFYRREQRDHYRKLAALSQVSTETHLLEVPSPVRRARVQQRNGGSQTKTVEVSDQMFDWAEGWFETLSEEERTQAVLLSND